MISNEPKNTSSVHTLSWSPPSHHLIHKYIVINIGALGTAILDVPKNCLSSRLFIRICFHLSVRQSYRPSVSPSIRQSIRTSVRPH